jgi:hypothetical protein
MVPPSSSKEHLLEAIQTQVVVTDAVHGISGFFDLAVEHCAAFWTIRAEEAAGASELFHLTGSKAEDIDVVMTVDEVDVEKQQQTLDCYVTYQQTIEQAGAKRNIPREAVFEVYQEAYDPALSSLVAGLIGN